MLAWWHLSFCLNYKNKQISFNRMKRRNKQKKNMTKKTKLVWTILVSTQYIAFIMANSFRPNSAKSGHDVFNKSKRFPTGNSDLLYHYTWSMTNQSMARPHRHLVSEAVTKSNSSKKQWQTHWVLVLGLLGSPRLNLSRKDTWQKPDFFLIDWSVQSRWT